MTTAGRLSAIVFAIAAAFAPSHPSSSTMRRDALAQEPASVIEGANRALRTLPHGLAGRLMRP